MRSSWISAPKVGAAVEHGMRRCASPVRFAISGPETLANGLAANRRFCDPPTFRCTSSTRWISIRLPRSGGPAKLPKCQSRKRWSRRDRRWGARGALNVLLAAYSLAAPFVADRPPTAEADRRLHQGTATLPAAVSSPNPLSETTPDNPMRFYDEEHGLGNDGPRDCGNGPGSEQHSRPARSPRLHRGRQAEITHARLAEELPHHAKQPNAGVGTADPGRYGSRAAIARRRLRSSAGVGPTRRKVRAGLESVQ